MKRVLLSLAIAAMASGAAMAQSHDDHKGHNHGNTSVQAPTTGANIVPSKEIATATATTSTTLTVQNVVFNEEVHDFGTIPEGPNAEVEFTFKNTGKEPVIIQQVRPSCGCTTPTWSKEPVLPGKTGTIKASYATQGRPNGFTKGITVVSNAGTQVLTIKGNVEPLPTGSVPSNKSMIKN